MISTRTKTALAAAKTRGVRLGGDRGNLPAVAQQGHAAGLCARQGKVVDRAFALSPRLNAMALQGESLRGMARTLTGEGIPAPRGGPWTAAQVNRALDTAGTLTAAYGP
ncbi:recombinase family protein [Methylobacterium sp. NEAU 140]|uniref:recombinase family protein n=1 Tax=Methylobacterium sp. NEAU 140 TaxID=3064945 RepID=UPI0027337126|nr:recombinase family protein [Methylobacterium sp. NEAU 140]MDP4027010.1 recombinase family protein [Methylobacterium sp. NEAU 140]